MIQEFQSQLIIAQDLSATPQLESEFPLHEEHFHKVSDIWSLVQLMSVLNLKPMSSFPAPKSSLSW